MSQSITVSKETQKHSTQDARKPLTFPHIIAILFLMDPFLHSILHYFSQCSSVLIVSMSSQSQCLSKSFPSTFTPLFPFHSFLTDGLVRERSSCQIVHSKLCEIPERPQHNALVQRHTHAITHTHTHTHTNTHTHTRTHTHRVFLFTRC